VLTAQYHFNPSTTFRDAALEVVDAARSLGGTSAANVAWAAFEDRGIL
jgi:Zn-dependent metalloprotease